MNILNTEVGGYWVAEYSAQQNAFHIDFLKGALSINAQLIAKKQNNGYLIFGLFETGEEANAACDEMRHAQDIALSKQKGVDYAGAEVGRSPS